MVDTVGCGDSFAAAIVAGFINSHDIPGTLVLANAVGAATATGRGAGTNVADVATVQQLLRKAARGGRHGAHAVQSAQQLLRATLAAGGLGGEGLNGNGRSNGNGNGSVGNGSARCSGGGEQQRSGESGSRQKAARAA